MARTFRHPRLLLLAANILLLPAVRAAEIQPAADAPRPLSPEESARQMQLPPGFRLECVASEPLIREPSGVCWDEQGRLYVCELHGYNLEGHLDVQELNKTGKLDHEIRRIQANPQAKEAARAGTYGTVKRLLDTDGDGRMDRVQVLADRLPPCYGLTPARGGLIVACAPDIVFLADRDNDGLAEVRETLFTGFATGALERGVNCPQWHWDGWIYLGRGHGGGIISGPHLPQPVRLGGSDFRIRPDGSALEPVTGSTHTFGHAFTPFGERFVMTTSLPGLYVTPLPWTYLARNPHAASPATEQPASRETRVFPISQPHPWRQKRAQDPGFYKYYRDRYGTSDSEASGYFTSGCGPLIYQDIAFPSPYQGHYFLCEPSQNLIHRALLEPDGPGLRLRRAPDEAASEFLASRDTWFHPIHLAHGPEGALYIVDLYREIIEDYSAIPRYLQQQYGLTQGEHHGRLWRLTHTNAPPAPPPAMADFSSDRLVAELATSRHWRRQTAQRLLLERADTAAIAPLAALVRTAADPTAVLLALYTLGGLNRPSPADTAAALIQPHPQVRRHALRLAERWLDADTHLWNLAVAMSRDTDPSLLLQLALSLGTSRRQDVVPVLAGLARAHGDIRWMPPAILTALRERGGAMLAELSLSPTQLNHGLALLEPLAASIGARHDPSELAASLRLVTTFTLPDWQLRCLRGFQAGLKGAPVLTLPDAARAALSQLQQSSEAEVRRSAAELASSLNLHDPAQRRALLSQAGRDAADLRLAAELRLAAVARLAEALEPEASQALLAAWPTNTPKVRDAILEALFTRHDRLPSLLQALEQQTISPSTLTAFQRVTLLEHENSGIRERAARMLQRQQPHGEAIFRRFAAALAGPRDPARGEALFREHCATCHQVRGLGFAVGPDLGAEFQRAEETILRDILDPNQTISPGYPTLAIETAGGQVLHGIVASESATSLTLRQPAGLEHTLLRQHITRLTPIPVSLMPEQLAETLSPADAANLIAWLRQTPAGIAPDSGQVILFEDDPAFLDQLTEGGGTTVLVRREAFSGEACFAVTPLQRHAATIPGWNYPIAEKPGPGQYRYLRLAWRTEGGEGVMIELAAQGRWPDAKDPRRRYYAGRNTTEWAARQVSSEAPGQWRCITLDLWKDNGAFMLTGVAPTALGGRALFDRIELLRHLEAVLNP